MYKVSQKQLHGENKVMIDQFTFGKGTDSPDATSLPVRLAVALLKDRHGKIAIDLPVRGDLNEPDFRVWPGGLERRRESDHQDCLLAVCRAR